MDAIVLRNQLLEAKTSPDFISEAESIVDSLTEEEAGLESVSVILKFMEEYPAFDFGTPGPLVHFIEKFYGRGYEAELFASIARRPTTHTLWLLNRIINGTKQAADRARLITILRQAEGHPLADAQAKRIAAHFLQRLS
jgi:hypothetical protein